MKVDIQGESKWGLIENVMKKTVKIYSCDKDLKLLNGNHIGN